MPAIADLHGFWDYTTPGTGGLEQYSRDDYLRLLDDMAEQQMNCMVLVLRWHTTGYVSKLRCNDQMPEACNVIREGNGLLRDVIDQGRRRGIDVWLSGSLNIFRVDRVSATPFSKSSNMFGYELGFEAGRYDTDQEEVCDWALAMSREFAQEFPEMAGFVVELEACGYELPHRAALYDAWAKKRSRKPFVELGHPLNAREPDIIDWRDFTTDNRAALLKRIEAAFRDEGFDGRLAVFCETGRQAYLISQDVNLDRLHALCPAWEAVTYDYSYCKTRMRLGMMELAIEEPKRAGMKVHYLPRGVMTYANPEPWPLPVTLAEHWQMDLEDIAQFKPDGVWWFGADCSASGAHVDPKRLHEAGYANGEACRKDLLRTIAQFRAP